MHLMRDRGLQHVRRLDDPLGAARGNEKSQHRGINSREQPECFMRADRNEQSCELRRKSGADDHPEDHRVERKLDQHAAHRGNRFADGFQKAARPPVQQQSGRQEDQVISVEIERRERALRRRAKHVGQIPDGNRGHENRQKRAEFEPFARLRA